MKRLLIKEKGNITFSVALFAVLVILLLMLFSIIISKSTLNLILHEIRSDLYLVNRNAIFAIQRDLMGEDIESLNEDELEELISKGISISWGLDKKLRNGTGIIKEAKILDIEVLEDGEIDTITKKEIKNFTVHTVIKVKVIPMVFEELVGEKCEFNLHQDIKLEKAML